MNILAQNKVGILDNNKLLMMLGSDQEEEVKETTAAIYTENIITDTTFDD